jgi:hypothetical protein
MPEGGAVFRGLSGLALPPEFFEPDEQGCAGGGGLLHVDHAVGGGYSQVQRRERGTGFDILSPPVGKNSEKSEHSAFIW